MTELFTVRHHNNAWRQEWCLRQESAPAEMISGRATTRQIRETGYDQNKRDREKKKKVIQGIYSSCGSRLILNHLDYAIYRHPGIKGSHLILYKMTEKTL